MNRFLLITLSTLCFLGVVNARADISSKDDLSLHMLSNGCPCFKDVTVVYKNGSMTEIKYKGKKTSGEAFDVLKEYLDQCSSVSSDDLIGSGDTSGNGVDGTGSISGMGYMDELEDEISKIMYINPETVTNASEKEYQDNLNSVHENRNKIQFNAATRAIALGQRATALSTQSGKDITTLKTEVEKTDNMLALLKKIAQLEGQSLSKTNEITSMRAKLLELSSIESIISSDVITTQEKKK